MANGVTITEASSSMARRNSLNDARIAGLYDLGRTIGKGHYAVVKLAKHVFTGELVAVKVCARTPPYTRTDTGD
jgi:SNF-related kinase